MSKSHSIAGLQEQELHNILDDVMGSEQTQIDIPNESELYSKPAYVNDPNSAVNINGVWCHPAIARIHNWIIDGHSPVIGIVGKTGKGKSRTGLVLCNKLHEIGVLRGSFNPREQVIYRVIPFLLFYRNSTRRAVMLDEANESVNKNSYNSDMNKAVAGVLRTQRLRENVNVFIGPELQEFDPRIRNNVDMVFDMKEKQYAEVTKYENKHGKRGSRGLDFNFQNYPDWRVPDCPEQLDSVYDEIDRETKGQYIDEFLEKVLTKKMQELEDQRIKD